MPNNGGHTWTHQPSPGSTAIDAGKPEGAPANDQRGIRRPDGAGIDIGAVEVTKSGDPLDSDNDGLLDADETNVYHTDPFLSDTDGDSFDDGVEVQSKSDPTNAQSVPEIIRTFTAVELEVFTNLGHKYQIETSANLVDWTTWGSTFDGVGGKSGHLVSVRGKAAGYWRLKRVQ